MGFILSIRSVIQFFALSAGLLLLSVSAASAQNAVEILAVHFPPYEMEKPEGGLPGFDVEVYREAFDRVGRKGSVAFLPWKRAVHLSKTGRAPGVLSCAYKPSRDKDFIFSDVLSYATRGYYVRPEFDASGRVELDIAKGQTVTAVTGYTTEKTMQELGVTIDPSPTDIAAIRKLVNRRVDMFFTSKESADYIGRPVNLANSMKFLTVKTIPYYVCFSRSWPNAEKLVEEFNRGLRVLRSEGRYEEIHAKYSAKTS